jgi:integrase
VDSYTHGAELIELGMYAGARMEELCALRVDKVHGSKGYIEIEDAKTAAGWRQVPIHSKLKATVERLVSERKDGFVLASLTADKYGDRSPAIGKRFGRLKTALGFGRKHVFHSIRHTVDALGERWRARRRVCRHHRPRQGYDDLRALLRWCFAGNEAGGDREAAIRVIVMHDEHNRAEASPIRWLACSRSGRVGEHVGS